MSKTRIIVNLLFACTAMGAMAPMAAAAPAPKAASQGAARSPLDWQQPVDGSNPATEWQGLNEIRDSITKGQFKDVLFYRADIEKQLERRYHPGK